MGERCQFKISGLDPDFQQSAVWFGFDDTLAERKDFEKKKSEYFLKLEIEITEIRPPKHLENQNIFELSTPEKKEIALKLKKEADEHFKTGDFQKASDVYTQAYKTIFFEDGEDFGDLKFKIGSNLALMSLKLKRYEDCINMNDQLIRFGYSVTDKTYFRNGQACEQSGRYEDAIKYYTQAAEASTEPELKQSVEATIAGVKKKQSEKQNQLKKNMQKMWGS